MIPLLLALILGSASATPDSVLNMLYPPSITFTIPAEPPPVVPDFYRYRVTYRWHGHRCIRWRTDYVMTTIVTSTGDTLGSNMTASQVVDMIQRTTLPDTTNITPIQWVARYEQRRNGDITRLYFVRTFDEDHLRARDARWKKRAAPVTLVISHPPCPSL